MLTLNGIEKSFGDNHVLRGVSFQVNKGEIYGLIGKNGAGKTTLLNIIAGISSADDGEYTYDDAESTVLNRKAKIGYLPDSPHFFEYLTCAEYLDFLLMENNSARRKDLLELVELSPDVRISTLSRGMRQRLGIAGAIVGNPDIVLLDEPTSALDPSGRADVLTILKELRHDGKSIILSTHILADMETVCDQVGFLADGVIKRNLHISDLDKYGNTITVSFGANEVKESLLQAAHISWEKLAVGVYRFELEKSNGISSQQKLFRFLAELSFPIESIHSETGTLDKVFQEVCQ